MHFSLSQKLVSFWGYAMQSDLGGVGEKMRLRDMDEEQVWMLTLTLGRVGAIGLPGPFLSLSFLDRLDRESWAELEGNPLGAPTDHPRELLCGWLYGFISGVRSCRKLETPYRDQIPYLWLRVCAVGLDESRLPVDPAGHSLQPAHSLNGMALPPPSPYLQVASSLSEPTES